MAGSVVFEAKKMSIPIKDTFHKTIPLQEGAIISDKSYLIERAHVFNEQYVWARKCAESAYDMILKQIPQKTFRLKNPTDTDVQGVVLNVNNRNLLTTSGSIDGLEDNGFIKITINANTKITEKTEDLAIYEIQSVIVHELGHGNIYWKRYVNHQEINDTPNDYSFCVSIISSRGINYDSVIYKFCFACYSTYYHEVQAFISQTYGEILKEMHNIGLTKRNVTKKKFQKLLVNTEVYSVFHHNIEFCNQIENDKNLLFELSSDLRAHGFGYTSNRLLKKIKKIKEISQDALKCAYNSAYVWFFDN